MCVLAPLVTLRASSICLSPRCLLLRLILQRDLWLPMWVGGFFVGIKKRIGAVSVACVCVLDRSLVCWARRVWQLILNAGGPLERNQIVLRYFMLASPSLFCAVLFPVDLHSFIVSLYLLLQMPLYFASAL